MTADQDRILAAITKRRSRLARWLAQHRGDVVTGPAGWRKTRHLRLAAGPRPGKGERRIGLYAGPLELTYPAEPSTLTDLTESTANTPLASNSDTASNCTV